MNRIAKLNLRLRMAKGVIGLVLGLLMIPLYAEAAAPVQISIGDAQVLEGNAGTVNLEFNVQREGGSDLGSNVVIPYTVTPSGSNPATPGVDYIAPAANATLRIPVGQASRSLRVPVIGDTAVEANETLQVQFGKAAALAPGINFLTAPNFPAGSGPRGIAQGDFNGDNVSDLAVANLGDDTVSILLGNGAGGFGPPTNLAAGIQPVFVLAADFDGDSRLDLAVAGNGDSRVRIFKGNGAGGFTALSPVTVGSGPISIAAGDFNGDGRLDLAVANQVGNVSILRGNGAGGFTVSSTVTVGAVPFSITACDLDGDGTLDLAIANFDSDNVSILRGNGTGGFSLLRTIVLGTDSGPAFITSDDFDGDGRFDLAVANFSNSSIAILRGTGAGAFAAPIILRAGVSPFSIAADDFNGDGHRDLAVANAQSDDVSILLGDGTGGFAAPVNFDGGAGAAVVVAGNFDGDSHRDLAVADIFGNSVSILRGDGAGGFAAAIHYLALTPYATTTGDFNGDGYSDLAVTSQDGGGSLLLGNGAGGFTASSASFATGTDPFSIVAGDFDGDGKLDLAVANAGSNNVSFLRGDGAGGFAAKVDFSIGAGATNPASIIAGDFNNDGRLDLATANRRSSNVSILLGDGTGHFAASTLNTDASPRTIAAGDFNGDGNLDLAVANVINLSIRLGDGAGHFSLAGTADGNAPGFVATGDFNGDGKLDVAFIDIGYSYVQTALGDGAGGLARPVPSSVGNNTPVSAIPGDFDGDGHLDLAVVNNTGNSSDGSGNVTILRGDGAGRFAPPVSLGALANPLGLTIGDFDRDGDLDLAVADNAVFSVVVTRNQAALPVVINDGTATGTILNDDGGDTTPDQFRFIDVSDVPLSTVQTSNSVGIAGINASAPISVTGGQYSIGCSEAGFTANPGTIASGATVCVRMTSSAHYGTEKRVSLIVGGVVDRYSTTTLARGTKPTTFRFFALSNVARSSINISNPVTPEGLTTATPISVRDGQYSIGCTLEGLTANPGTIEPGQTVCVLQRAAPSYSTAKGTELTVGSATARFTTTTIAAPAP